LTVLAIATVPLLLGAAETGLFVRGDATSTAKVNSTVRKPTTDREIRFEGSLTLTESPIGSELVSEAGSRSKERARSDPTLLDTLANSRSGLTKGKQIDLFSPDPPDELGDDAALFLADPEQTTSVTRLGSSGTYRTLCVRLCDGYYWPISFSTSRDGLAEDRATCQSSCGTPVELYYYRSLDGAPEDAVDLAGERYASLANAFRYRSQYVESCKCQPDPWEAASLERHQKYAALAKEGKLALWDKRTPLMVRKARVLVATGGLTISTPFDTETEAVGTSEDTPMTAISSSKSMSLQPALTIRNMGSEAGSPGRGIGIATLGKSASGMDYSAKR
jgi:hypothetical protein